MCVLSTLLLLWDLTLLCGADSSLPPQDDMAPLQVEFHSVNFRNILQWKHHHGTPDDLQYFVQYKVYGDKQWSVCELCQAIHELQCDLSQETSDTRQWYYARVQSWSSTGLSSWVLSARFNPQWDTTFSPPQIRLNVTEQGIVVRIRPPRTPFQGQRNTRITVTKLLKLMFRIYVMHSGVEQCANFHQQTYETEGCSRKLVIEPLSPGRMYCVQAVTVMPLSGLTSARSPSSCIRTL